MKEWIGVEEFLPDKPGDYICALSDGETVTVLTFGYVKPMTGRLYWADRVFTCEDKIMGFGEDWSSQCDYSDIDNCEEVKYWRYLPLHPDSE